MRVACILLALFAIVADVGSSPRPGTIVPRSSSRRKRPAATPVRRRSNGSACCLFPRRRRSNRDLLSGCTAQFITPKVLLTAGHCIKDLETNPTGPWPDPTKGTFWLQYQNNQGTPFKSSAPPPIRCGRCRQTTRQLSQAQRTTALATAMQHDFSMLLVDAPEPDRRDAIRLDWKGKSSSPGGLAIRQTSSAATLFNAWEALCFLPTRSPWAMVAAQSRGAMGTDYRRHPWNERRRLDDES